MNLPKIFPLLLLLICSFPFNNIQSQQKVYSVANAHSHNDYKQSHPFVTAYKACFGSIEADVFLRNNKLLVAHDTSEILQGNTLEKLYFDPLSAKITTHHGQVYKDASRQLILLIDIKEEAISTLQKLIDILKDYPALTDCASLKMVITGNQPATALLTTYPAYLYFDGHVDITYTPEALKKIALFSDNFRTYSKWNGNGLPAKADQLKLDSAVTKAHALNKPIRFWGGPDVPNAWLRFTKMGVDYLNTDYIHKLARYIKKL